MLVVQETRDVPVGSASWFRSGGGLGTWSPSPTDGGDAASEQRGLRRDGLSGAWGFWFSILLLLTLLTLWAASLFHRSVAKPYVFGYRCFCTFGTVELIWPAVTWTRIPVVPNRSWLILVRSFSPESSGVEA